MASKRLSQYPISNAISIDDKLVMVANNDYLVTFSDIANFIKNSIPQANNSLTQKYVLLNQNNQIVKIALGDLLGYLNS